MKTQVNGEVSDIIHTPGGIINTEDMPNSPPTKASSAGPSRRGRARQRRRPSSVVEAEHQTAKTLGIPQIHKHRQAAATSKYGSIPVRRIHLSENLKTLIMAAQGGLQGASCYSLTKKKRKVA